MRVRASRDLPSRQLSRHDARRRFLSAVHALYPEVFSDLETRFIDVRRAVADDGKSLGARDETRALDALNNWMRKWHLKADWVPWWAEFNINLWRDDRRMRGLVIEPPIARSGSDSVIVGMNEWDLPDRKVSVLFADLNLYDDSEIDTAIAQFRQHQRRLVTTSVSLRFVQARHLEWLARYQVGAESYRTIRRESGSVASQTIAEAIHRAAAFIQLRLRSPMRAGRPQGSRTADATHQIVRVMRQSRRSKS